MVLLQTGHTGCVKKKKDPLISYLELIRIILDIILGSVKIQND